MRLPWTKQVPTLTKYEVSKVLELMCPKCSGALVEFPRIMCVPYLNNYCPDCDNTYVIRVLLREEPD